MHDVGRGTGELGKGHQVVHTLGFDGRRPAFVMLGRAGFAGGEQLLAALGHQRLVFTVGGDDDAELLGELERPVKLGVVDAERVLVGEEDFEGTNAAPDNLAQLPFRFLVKLRHAHVEREIAGRLAYSLAHPELEGGQGVILPRRAAHLDQRSRAADERGLAAGLVGVL